jgi:dihydroflavonol-4-reductase
MAPAYVQSRVDAEKRFFDCCRERGLPGVACCVGNTYGEADVKPTPHGKLLRDVATGRR